MKADPMGRVLGLLPPLVEREIRVASRRWTTYWGRVSVLGLGLAPVVVAYLGGELGMARPGFGASLLMAQAVLLFCWVGLTAIQFASDAISFEKREGTLGLLFLTSLTSWDVVLGKLAAASMRIWHGLLAVIPALGVSLLLGGVTMSEVLRLALVLGNALFVLVALTLFVSTCGWRERSVVAVATLLAGALLGGIPLLNALGLRSPVMVGLNLANPVMPLTTLLEPRYRLNPGWFWQQLGAAQVLGWGLVGLSCWMLPRVWRERAASGWRGNWRMAWRQWLLGARERRAKHRRTVLARRPMEWYASREQRTWWAPWVLLGLLVAGVVATRLLWPAMEFELPGVVLFSWCAQLVFKHWLVSSASQVFSRGDADGAGELILSTSLSDREIVTGPIHAMIRRFLGPVCGLMVLEVVLVWLVAEPPERYGREPSWMAIMVALLAMFPVDLAAVTVVGLWKGVVSKNASQAMSGTNFWVLVMPWLVTLGLLLSSVAGRGGLGVGDALLMMGMLSFLFDFILTGWAWQKLAGELRVVMFDRLAGGEPWLGGWRAAGRAVGELFAARREP